MNKPAKRQLKWRIERPSRIRVLRVNGWVRGVIVPETNGGRCYTWFADPGSGGGGQTGAAGTLLLARANVRLAVDTWIDPEVPGHPKTANGVSTSSETTPEAKRKA